MIKAAAIGILAGAAAALLLTLARPVAAPFAPPLRRPTFARHTLEVLPPPALEGPRLDRLRVSFVFHNDPLSRALDEFRDKTGANLIVDWEELADEGVTGDTPVTAHLTDVPAPEALRIILASAYSRRGKARWVRLSNRTVDFGLRNGVIMVTGGERGYLAPSSHGYLRVYDVRDLMLESARTTRLVLRALPDAPPPPPAAIEVTEEAVSHDTPPTAEAYAFEQLAEAIKRSIDAPSWYVTEGEGGEIHYWAGRIIVLQTLENHERVEKFLTELRAKLHGGQGGTP